MDLATERETDREPNFEKRFKEWEVVIKKPFLDAERCVRNIIKLLNVYTCISAPFITFRLFWFNFQLAVAFFVPSISGAERSLRPRLYGEKLSRARGSPSLPSQLYVFSVYMRKKLTPLPEPRANFPITTELAHRKRVTWLGG